MMAHSPQTRDALLRTDFLAFAYAAFFYLFWIVPLAQRATWRAARRSHESLTGCVFRLYEGPERYTAPEAQVMQ